VNEIEISGKGFISKPGDFEDIAADALDEAYLRSTEILHVALITPAAAKACDIVHDAGGKVSVDANYYRPYTYNYYDKIDFFIGSETYYLAFCEDKGFAQENYKDNMHVLAEMGPEIVIFTFGERGCKGIHGEEYFEVPAIPVKTVDTTGAGDVFHGAFDVFYLMGHSVRRAAELAAGVSAIKCMYPGGRAGIPTLPVLEKFLAFGVLDTTELDERAAHYFRGIMNE
jgi:sugar/nucleoside kinase (ribokinase family)